MFYITIGYGGDFYSTSITAVEDCNGSFILLVIVKEALSRLPDVIRLIRSYLLISVP
jgi:hypothetical protein